MAERLMELLRWLVGYAVFSVAGDAPWRFFTRAAKLGYTLWGMQPQAEGTVRASARLKALPELEELAKTCGCTLTVEKKSGLSRVILWLWGRKGLLTGLVLAVLLYAQFTGRVWNITVHGCDVYTQVEILAAAEECGVYVGVKKSAFDPRAAGAAMMLRLPKVGWISLNTRASFVEIEIREAIPKPEAEEKEGLSIVSAGRDGQIVSCEALAGRLLVAPGDVVQEGQMLVTGVQETLDGGALFVNARAKIMARTWRSFTVELPVTVEEAHPTGEEHTRRSLQIFSLHIPLGFSAMPQAQGDVTVTSEPLVLLGVEVPVVLHTEVWSGTQNVFHQRTEEELQHLAEEALLALARRELGEGGIIEEQMIELSIQGDICTARLSCTCVEDIAVEIPIVITGNP